MCNVDLHTHSVASPDGGLSAADYRRMLARRNGLMCIAITDHNTIAFAQKLQAELGEQIIVGEEINTTEGEIVGLYLKKRVPSGLSLTETVRCITRQGGLVYVPHPFETRRHGLPAAALATIVDDIAIVEVCNGRAIFQNRSKAAYAWAAAHDLPGAASSDAHGRHGWGKTYSIVAEPPTRGTIVSLLRNAHYQSGSPGVRGVLYPKFHRLRKRSERHA